MHRLAFDPALPVVAASPFMAAGRSFTSGESVDWRALGINEQVLLDWWRTGQVSFLPKPPAEPERVTFIIDGSPVEMTAGERIHVHTPAQQRKQRR